MKYKYTAGSIKNQVSFVESLKFLRYGNRKSYRMPENAALPNGSNFAGGNKQSVFMQMFCRFRAEFFGAIVATAIPINSYLDYIGLMKQIFVSFF